MSNVSGRIKVTGTTGDEIRIEAVQSGRDSRDDSIVEIVERSGRVEVRTRPRRGRVRVDFDVTVPRSTRVVLGSVSGDISVANIQGELEANSVSGSVRIESATRLAKARSVSGDVWLESGTSGDEVVIGSVSGDVRANGLKAKRLDLEVVSGDVDLRETSCERLDFSSVSGSLDYSGELASTGRYHLRSHSGDLRFRLANDVGFEVRAETFSGQLEIEMPITLGGGARLEAGRQRSIRGVYREGGAYLDVTTFSGNLVIRRQ